MVKLKYEIYKQVLHVRQNTIQLITYTGIIVFPYKLQICVVNWYQEYLIHRVIDKRRK